MLNLAKLMLNLS